MELESAFDTGFSICNDIIIHNMPDQLKDVHKLISAVCCYLSHISLIRVHPELTTACVNHNSGQILIIITIHRIVTGINVAGVCVRHLGSVTTTIV